MPKSEVTMTLLYKQDNTQLSSVQSLTELLQTQNVSA